MSAKPQHRQPQPLAYSRHPRTSSGNSARLAARLIHWHRRVGLLLLPVLLMLAITGIMINHSQSWQWHQQPVYSRLVGWLYGIPAARIQQSFEVKGHWLSEAGDQLWLDLTALGHCNQLLGAAYWQETMVTLCSQQPQLWTIEGELVESLPSLPAPAIGLVIAEGGHLIAAGREQAWQLDESSWQWQPTTTDQPLIVATPLPAPLQQSLTARLPLPDISRERLLLDLHSGRLFGDIGVWIVDASGVLLVFLCLTGAWSWLRRQLGKRHAHGKGRALRR